MSSGDLLIKFFANCQYTAEEAEEHIAAGKADAVVFARRFISNPDLALRFAQDRDIDMRSVEAKDQSTWYGYPDGHKCCPTMHR
jgi:2,4-dienoyl-CoA reductase-like NADH-dependent reductase (Old Yellow Enzyme family)